MQLKPFFSYEQQLEALKGKGIIMYDPMALEFLEGVNYYYRFSAYLLPLKNKSEKLSFSRLRRIYEFACRLRAHIFPVIESIKVNLWAMISYIFAEKIWCRGIS